MELPDPKKDEAAIKENVKIFNSVLSRLISG